MTDRQKIELIKRSINMLEDELTTEEYNFLYGRSWENVPEEEKQLWYTAWRETPGTIEHAAYNTDCCPAEIVTAAKVVRAIRESWLDTGIALPKEFDKNTPAGELLELLERVAAQMRQEAEELRQAAEAQEAAQAQQPQQPQELKPCPFCGAEAHIIHNAVHTAITDTGIKETKGAMIYCTQCPAQLFTPNTHAAADMWNRRSEGGEAAAEE